MPIERAIGSEQISPLEARFLAQSMTRFLLLPPDGDLYRTLGESLRELFGKAMVSVNTFDESNCLAIKALSGFEAFLEPFRRATGLEPFELRFPLTEASRSRMAQHEFFRVGRFAELTMKNCPEALREYLDQLFADREVYALSFHREGELYADAIALIPQGHPLPNHHLIEAFIQGTSVALQRRRSEEALRQSESHYRGLFEHASALVALMDLEANILDINEAGANFIGKPRDQLIGSSALSLFPPDSLGRFEQMLKGKRSGERSSTCEAEFYTAAGLRTIEFCAHPILRDGKPYQFQGIAHDITEKKRLEEDHRAFQSLQIETLTQANRLKDEFLSVISHELRTPLNAIQGFGSLLLDQVGGTLSPQQHSFVEQIMGGSDRMLRLIEDLLDLAKMRAGMLELQPSLTLYSPLVEEALATLEPLARAKSIRFSQEISVEGEVLLDGPRIIQVLLNLLMNAIKFSKTGGEIGIRAFVRDGCILTEIRDQGIGIAAENLEKLFTPFQQLDMSLTRQVNGTGLGLSICKGFVEAHGGTIEAWSAGPERGATFRFSLPVRKQAS